MNNTTQEFKEQVTNHLQQGKVSVTFTKKNGEVRTLKCTLSPEFLPEIKNADRKSSDEALSVFDLDNAEWRAFRWDSVTTVDYL